MGSKIYYYKSLENIFKENRSILRNSSVNLTTKADIVMNLLIEVMNIDFISSLKKKENLKTVEDYFNSLELSREEKEICEYIMMYIKKGIKL